MVEPERGIVMLFTGDGKGKTTAALGAAMRAAGHGARVFVIQFMKGRLYGELAAAGKIENLTIEQYGRDEFVDSKNPEAVDIELASKGWKRALEIVSTEQPDMLVLDEINVAVSFGLIPQEDVIDFTRGRPAGMDLILTGRYAPDRFLEIADTVTEMKEIKHHYNDGVEMRKGIEY
jgi:cob(I)alamin adenosyltransferase